MAVVEDGLPRRDTMPYFNLPKQTCAQRIRLDMVNSVTMAIERSYLNWIKFKEMGHEFNLSPDTDLLKNRDWLWRWRVSAFIVLESAQHTCECFVCGEARKVRTEAGERRSSEPLKAEDYPQQVPKYLRALDIMKNARCRPSRPARAPPSSSHLPHLEPQRFQIIKRRKTKDFDDYFGGPTLESMMEFAPMPGVESQPLPWNYRPTRLFWELWRDWGYRIEREFALMYLRAVPVMVAEHLLPTPPLHGLEWEEDDEKFEQGDEEEQRDDEGERGEQGKKPKEEGGRQRRRQRQRRRRRRRRSGSPIPRSSR